MRRREPKKRENRFDFDLAGFCILNLKNRPSNGVSVSESGVVLISRCIC